MRIALSKIKICSINDAKDVNLIVDTSATFTKISASLATELVRKCGYETDVELEDSNIKGGKLAIADIEIEGIYRPVLISVEK